MESELTQSTINNLYTRHTEPKISTLRAICNAFGISLSEFFNEKHNPDEELIIYVKTLSKENKQALLTLLRALNNIVFLQ